MSVVAGAIGGARLAEEHRQATERWRNDQSRYNRDNRSRLSPTP